MIENFRLLGCCQIEFGVHFSLQAKILVDYNNSFIFIISFQFKMYEESQELKILHCRSGIIMHAENVFHYNFIFVFTFWPQIYILLPLLLLFLSHKMSHLFLFSSNIFISWLGFWIIVPQAEIKKAFFIKTRRWIKINMNI